MDFIEIVKAICAFVMAFEGCRLKAYPDPGTGGAPWTIGYGETLGVKEGDVWTQEYAEEVLRKRVTLFMLGVLKRCPRLYLEPPGRLVGCTSLAYNIGLGAFGASSVCRRTLEGMIEAAAKAFLLWNKAGGRVMRGLNVRRRAESARYLKGNLWPL